MRGSDIGLNLLMRLDVLLRESSVSKAAELLGLTQSAMSHSLGVMRSYFDDPLLVRAGRGMALTPKASRLAPRLAAAMRSVEALWHEGADQPLQMPAELTIIAGESLQQILCPSISAILYAKAPHVVLRVMPNTGDAIDLLRRGAADLGLGEFGSLPPDVRGQTLIKDRMVCVVRRGHPITKTGLTLHAYNTLPHVHVIEHERMWDLARRQSDRAGLAPAHRFVNSTATAVAIVATSESILTLPALAANIFARSHGLQRVSPPLVLPQRVLSMIWHTRIESSNAAGLLRQVVLETALPLQELVSPSPERPVIRCDDDMDPGRSEGSTDDLAQ